MTNLPAHYRPGLDVVRLGAVLPVLCYHFCIEAAGRGFAVPVQLIGRGMADWVEVGLAWFFLLSGAALCLQWQGRFRWRPYLVGRAAAMYPPFWLGFLVLFLYGDVLHGNHPDIPRWRVVFSLLGGVLLLGDPLPGALGLAGLCLIVGGMVGGSLSAGKQA